MIAKEVMPGKFWILEDGDGLRKGTLRAGSNGQLSAMLEGQNVEYPSWSDMAKDLKIMVATSVGTLKEENISTSHDVQGYPCKCEPHNPIWDVKRKLPLFTKTAKSRSLHAAGYYLIHFDHGWVTSFCPKVITLDSNEFQGPFKTKLEMRERLRKVNA